MLNQSSNNEQKYTDKLYIIPELEQYDKQFFNISASLEHIIFEKIERIIRPIQVRDC